MVGVLGVVVVVVVAREEEDIVAVVVTCEWIVLCRVDEGRFFL